MPGDASFAKAYRFEPSYPTVKESLSAGTSFKTPSPPTAWRGELERHFQRSSYRDDDDLVFPHPHTGAVLDHSALVRRFKATLRAGKVRPVRFNDLRHSFATAMAAAGVPMRTLQEWMGHRDFKTTLIYADYAPSAGEAELLERAFARNLGTVLGTDPSASESNSEQLKPPA